LGGAKTGLVGELDVLESFCTSQLLFVWEAATSVVVKGVCTLHVCLPKFGFSFFGARETCKGGVLEISFKKEAQKTYWGNFNFFLRVYYY
jgi:hypothetical protein